MTAVAVVTGATSGIGRALAIALAKPGWVVALLGRDLGRLDAIAAEVAQLGAAPVRIPVDLAVTADVERCSRRLRDTYPRVDVLVHAAGRYCHGPIEGLSTVEFDALYATNVRAPWLLTRELLPLLRASAGQVVMLNSSAVFTQARLCGAYAASKAALRTLTETLRAEIGLDGIRVLSLYPGRTATAMQERVHRAEGTPYRPERLLQPQDVAAVVVGALNLPRTAETTDIRIRPHLAP